MLRFRRRLRSWLHVADHPSWHHQPDYSFPLAHALANAYEQLHHAQQQPDPYFTAFRELVPFRTCLVCEQQRLNLEFALALAYTGDDSASYALTCLSSAWQIAEHLHDWGGQTEVGYLAGALWQMQGQLLDAYAVYQDALEALQRLARRDEPVDPNLELDLVVRLAGCAWELGWFPVCLRHLDEAYRLRATWAPDAVEEAASLAWLDSQLARVRGQPARALNQAAAAADLLINHGRPINGGRAHTILAESALDMLELTYTPTPPGDLWAAHARATMRAPLSRTDLLAQARKAAQLALEIAQDVHDPVGAMMARLASRRATRLSRHQSGDESGVAAAERLLRTARRLDDPSLLGRAEVALADELFAAGYSEAAHSTYQQAMHYFEEYHLGGLAFWPRRALQQSADS
jgi:hypothetical protein